MANRFTPSEKLLPAEDRRSVVKPIRWSPREWDLIESAARARREKPTDYMRNRILAGLAVVTVALGLLLGCVDTGGFRQLSQADQDTFKRCMKPIEPALCGNITSSVYEGMCLGGGQKTYAAQATPRARQEWLVANGCPPAMVQPAKFVADEPGDDETPPPPRSTGAETAAAAGAAAHASGGARAHQASTDEVGAK